MKLYVTIFAVFFCLKVGFAQTGIITTIAGNGYPHDTGFGGAAARAGICYSFCSSPDKNGNVYLSQSTCNILAMVSASGTINGFAGTGTAGSSGDGGLATAADITPGETIYDDSGNLYVSTQGTSSVGGRGGRIRKLI